MSNLFLFTGEDSYRLRQQAKAWKEAFAQKHGNMNLAVLDAQETSLNEISAALSALPFLGEKRLVFIHGLPEAPKTRNADKVSKKDEEREQKLKKFAQGLAALPQSTIAVFIQPNPDKRKAFFKALGQVAETKTFDPLEGSALIQWLLQEAASKGARMDRPVAEALAAMVGGDLWRLSQEVAKLATYASGQPVTKAMVEALAVPVFQSNIFHFTDALAARNHKGAIRQLHQMGATGESLVPAVYMIARQFRLLLQAQAYFAERAGATPAGLSASLKLHPFVARKLADQIRAFRFEQLKAAHQRLLEIDTDLKTSRIRLTTDNQTELQLALERFVLEFCRR